MKRLHVHMSVADIEQSVQFYSGLFAAQPAVRKPDYAKWMLDDPRVNFAISTQGRRVGVDHLGIQVESHDELAAVRERLDLAGGPITEQPEANCCYATSAKNWTVDPAGIAWETFFTFGESTDYGESFTPTAGACCAASPCGAPAETTTTKEEAPVKEAACCA